MSQLTIALAAASAAAPAAARPFPARRFGDAGRSAVAATGAASAATENTSPIATAPAASTDPAARSARRGRCRRCRGRRGRRTAKPFAEVIKDAKEQPGFFNLYSKDEKVWLEIKPEQIRPAVLPPGQPHAAASASATLPQPDAAFVHRRVPSGRQPGAAARQEHAVHRQRAARRLRARCANRPATACWARCRSRASRTRSANRC